MPGGRNKLLGGKGLVLAGQLLGKRGLERGDEIDEVAPVHHEGRDAAAVDRN